MEKRWEDIDVTRDIPLIAGNVSEHYGTVTICYGGYIEFQGTGTFTAETLIIEPGETEGMNRWNAHLVAAGIPGEAGEMWKDGKPGGKGANAVMKIKNLVGDAVACALGSEGGAGGYGGNGGDGNDGFGNGDGGSGGNGGKGGNGGDGGKGAVFSITWASENGSRIIPKEDFAPGGAGGNGGEGGNPGKGGPGGSDGQSGLPGKKGDAGKPGEKGTIKLKEKLGGCI